MTKKNLYRLAILLSAFLVSLWALNITTAHDGHKHRNAPVSSKKLKNPLQANVETIAAGRALFDRHCASCHGEDGKAKTEIAAAMKKRPTDLTAKEMHGITDGEVYWVTTNGIRKSGMPAFKSKATDQERWQMTVYVKHLMGEHSHTGPGGKSQTQIKYQFEETERGGRVRVITSNAKALAAIHEFLRFQISDHRTGDSGKVERTN